MADLLEMGDGVLLKSGRPWTPRRPFYAVIGDPVAHSRSPAMQTAALGERGIAADYVALRLEPGRLGDLPQVAGAQLLAGFNVTAPCKEAAARLCAVLSPEALQLGVVNTVRCEGGRWFGHNTDGGGLLAVMVEAWRRPLAPEAAVVLGAGASARSAVAALARWGVSRITVRSRSTESRRRFADWAAGWDLQADVTVSELIPGGEDAPAAPSVWICCLAGGTARSAYLPAAAGKEPALLIDLRYGDQLPPETPPLGFQALDGLPVLLMQGGLAFASWFGPPVPWAAMRRALAAD